MIQCPVHGVQGIVSCCEHISNAVDANQFEEAHIVVDGWGSAVMLCKQCRDRAVSNVEKAERSPKGGYDLDWGLPELRCCDVCASSWYDATGSGGFWELIDRSRRDAGFKVP